MHVGPQSGKFGVVHNFGLPITHMSNWTLDTVSHTPETYYASNTFAGADRNPGVIDWSGSFDVFNGGDLFFPGQYIACMELFTAPYSGVYGNIGNTYTGQAIVDSVVLSWAWGPEQSLTQTVNFSANGCVGFRDRVIADEVVATPDKMCGLQIQWADAVANEVPSDGDYAVIENVQGATLSLTAANPTYVNSSTGCCTHRRPGNIDWDLALAFTDHRSKIASRSALYAFRLFNNLTDAWQLLYGIFAGTAGINANRQTGEIQSQTANYQMKAFSYQTPVIGSISHVNDILGTPVPTVYWPVPATTSTVPPAPGQPSGTASGGDVDLSWAPSAGADGYTIWASGDGVDFYCVGCSTSASYTDVGVPFTGTIWYKIDAYNAQGQGDFSPISDPIVV